MFVDDKYEQRVSKGSAIPASTLIYIGPLYARQESRILLILDGYTQINTTCLFKYTEKFTTKNRKFSDKKF